MIGMANPDTESDDLNAREDIGRKIKGSVVEIATPKKILTQSSVNSEMWSRLPARIRKEKIEEDYLNESKIEIRNLPSEAEDALEAGFRTLGEPDFSSPEDAISQRRTPFLGQMRRKASFADSPESVQSSLSKLSV